MRTAISLVELAAAPPGAGCSGSRMTDSTTPIPDVTGASTTFSSTAHAASRPSTRAAETSLFMSELRALHVAVRGDLDAVADAHAGGDRIDVLNAAVRHADRDALGRLVDRAASRGSRRRRDRLNATHAGPQRLRRDWHDDHARLLLHEHRAAGRLLLHDDGRLSRCNDDRRRRGGDLVLG